MNEVTCVSGVSCGGKTAVLIDLDNSVSPKGRQLSVMVSDVTRKLRSDHEAFRRHVSFEEHAHRTSLGEYIQTIEYGGNFYSVRKHDVDEALQENKYVLVDCIPDGVRQFATHHPTKAVFIFTWPRELLKRHIIRGTAPDEMKWRLANAEMELKAAIDSGLYNLYINNTDLAETRQKVVALLDGESVESDVVDLETYSVELHTVLSELKEIENHGVKSRKN